MFDGVDLITLPIVHIGRSLALYRDVLGFSEIDRGAMADPVAWQELWGLPAPPSQFVVLGKPGSAGGWLRLVEVPGLPPATPAGRPDRPGPYALDFYTRACTEVEAVLASEGWEFVSEAVHYLLPGTTHPVRERMLQAPESGLLHAIVEYRPGRTRCVLGADAAQVTSEVVAVVFATADLDGARRFVRDVLRANIYFEGRFDGPPVEKMLRLEPGSGFSMFLARGAHSRNARLEFLEHMQPAGHRRAVDPVPRVIAGCAVADLDELARLLASGEHGVATGIVTIGNGRAGLRRLGLRSRYGAVFEFWQR